MTATAWLYSAPWARDGATNQPTTRTPKLMKAAAIIGGSFG
jgi:hypothetical protein